MKFKTIKSRILSFVITICMLLSIMPLALSAETELPTFSGGSGSETAPYLISTVADLQALAEAINSGAAQEVENYIGCYFKQTADIDLLDVESWEPIGYSSAGYYFAGNYDGGNHKILNMTCKGKLTDQNSPEVDAAGQMSAGFFGWVAFGSVSNLHIDSAKSILAQTTADTGNGQPYAGGLAAVIYASSVYNCSVSNSSVTATRESSNSGWAGGIAGWCYDNSSFEKVASVNNTITCNAYGGGFVAQMAGFDDTFTVNCKDCYVADCSIVTNDTVSSMQNELGSFVGELSYDDDNSILNITNCYVYNSPIIKGEDNVARITEGLFVGHHYYGTLNMSNSYYYTTETNTEKLGQLTGATAKTTTEFADGSVASALGSAFIDGEKYPILASLPADYSAVDSAIKAASELTPSNYTNYDAVTSAVNAVVRDKTISEQSTVDAMAKAITDAIAALEYKVADYSAVDAAIQSANALNADEYTDFTPVTNAVNAVVRDKNITEQSAVDAMAKAITDAIAALELKPSPETGDLTLAFAILAIITLLTLGAVTFASRKKIHE